MKTTGKKLSIFILLSLSIVLLSFVTLTRIPTKLNAKDTETSQVKEATKSEEVSATKEEQLATPETQETGRKVGDSKKILKGLEGKEYAIAPNGVKVPLDAKITDFETIEDFPFEALDETANMIDDSFTRMTINSPVEFPTKLKDGRKYNFIFGAMSNYRKVSNTSTEKVPTGSTQAPFRRDHAYAILPEKNMPIEKILNVKWATGIPTLPTIAGVDSVIPLYGTQVVIEPSKITEGDEPIWISSVYPAGFGAGSYQSGYAFSELLTHVGNVKPLNGGEMPQVLIMYKKGYEVYAYGVSYNSSNKSIDGYVRVKLAPKGVKGRVTMETTYVNALSKSREMALAYGIHVDINTLHDRSNLYSLGNYQGSYFEQKKVSDGYDYLLKYHTDGYDNQPDALFGNGLWGEPIWEKAKYHVNMYANFTTPGTVDPGFQKKYEDDRHPAVALRWNLKETPPAQIYMARFEQSITTANAMPPKVTKTAKNITTSNIANSNVDDFLEYSITVDTPTSIFDTVLEDVLPEGLSKPEYVKIDTYLNGKPMTTKDLDVDVVYTEGTRKLLVEAEELEPEKTVIRYKVQVLPEASDKLLTNRVVFNGVDFDDDPLEEEEATFDVKIKEIPYGFALIKYVDKDKKPLVDEVTLQGKTGTTITPEVKDIAGYILDKVEPPETLKYKVGTQTITYIYKEGRFTLKQEVLDSLNPSLDGKTVKNNQVLTYRVTLESLFKPETPAVATYQTVTVTENIGDYLESAEEITFLTKDGTVAGTGSYDPVKKEVKATLTNLTIDRSENLILTFKATVKKDALAETKIIVNGTATASYSNNMTAAEVRSKDVVSTVLGGLTLVSAPDGVNFGSVNVSDYQKEVAVDKNDMQTPLLVQDTRIKRTNWDVTAHIISDMTNGNDVRTGALKYYHKKTPLTLSNLPQPIYDNDGKNTTFEFNISDLWGKVAEAEGLKLDMSGGEAPSATNSYEGTIQWTVRDVIE